jgi:hypothetical protein
MTTAILSAVMVGLIVLYIFRRQSRLKSEETDY